MTASTVKSLSLLVIFFVLISPSAARDTISQAQPLHDTETLISPNGRFALGFFTPGKSNNRYVGLWYNEISVRTVVWVANRKNPVINSTGVLSISGTGSLLITDQNSTVVWSSGAARLTNPVAQILDNGNLVVRDTANGGGSFAWQGFDYPTDTLIAGMKIGVDLVTGLNRTLTAWTSDEDPSPSQYYVMMDIRGAPELVIGDGSTKLWRTGPWNGLRYSGIPDTLTYRGFNFSFINNKQEITYSFNTNLPTLSRLVVNQSGLAQRSLWVESGGFWNIFWYAPRDQCDSESPCGPYGVCNANDSPICNCLQGFTPRSPAEWELRDGKAGCVRKTRLDCKNGTDGFVPLPDSKLPDTTSVTLDMSSTLDECRARCLSNCSCTAYAQADVRNGGSGCIIWATDLTDLRVFPGSDGQVLFVRVAAADLGPSPGYSSKSRHVAVAAIVIPIVIVVAACAGCVLWRRKKRRTRGIPVTSSFHNRSSDEIAREHDLELPVFDLGAIASATDNFSHANKLGEGGFGPVYKGKLGDGQEVAVKRLAKTSVQGRDEFKNEVMLIAKLQHRNLVRLLGCCIEGEERVLIYEYMPNKSLDFFLFDKTKGEGLSWETRYQIIMGIARGLLYLHQDSRLRIIHRDLKASNILLDKEMSPKISDFGMARIFGGDEAEANTRKVVGTYGYMSPEYAMDGIFSQKSDVFSFGVLVLEIISGRKNRGVYLAPPHTNLLGHAWTLWKEGNSLQIVDESIGYSYPMNEVMRCIKVGLLCVQEHPEDRPLMSSVVLMLGSDTTLLPYPKQPGFATRRTPFEMESSTSKPESSSATDITVTTLEGR